MLYLCTHIATAGCCPFRPTARQCPAKGPSDPTHTHIPLLTAVKNKQKKLSLTISWPMVVGVPRMGMGVWCVCVSVQLFILLTLCKSCRATSSPPPPPDRWLSARTCLFKYRLCYPWRGSGKIRISKKCMTQNGLFA